MTVEPRMRTDAFITALDGNVAGITEDGHLEVMLPSKVITENSSKLALGAGGVFTGTTEEILEYSMMIVSVYADQDSATDGLSIQQSGDGTNWYFTDEFTISANSGKTFSVQTAARYFRVVYTNGAVAQGTFCLQTIGKHVPTKPSSHRIQDSIVDDDDGELVKAVLSAKANGGGYVNITATSSDNLRVTDAENGLAIAKGDVADTGFVHKFGHAGDIDTGDGFVTIWDGAGVFTGSANKVYNFSSTADIDTISSSNTGDTQDIEIQGLDSNWDLVTQTATLNGQNKVTLGTTLLRVFRMKNTGTTDIAGNVYCYVDTAISGGIPTDNTQTRAIIEGDNNQTLMALYSVPNGKTAYMRDWFASLLRSSDNQSRIKLFARPFGGVFQLKHQSAVGNRGSSYVQHQYQEPEVFAAKTDIILQADASANNTEVSGGFDIVLVDD